MNVGTGCGVNTPYYVDFAAPANELNISVRHMGSSMVSAATTFAASTYTGLGPDAQTCAKGPTGGSAMQSTFQRKGVEAGLFTMSSNSPTSGTKNAAFGKVFSPYVPVFRGPGDALEISADLRMPYTSTGAVVSPVVQYFYAINLMDTTANPVITMPWSFLVYDSRTVAQVGSAGVCDTVNPDDGSVDHNPFVFTKFSTTDLTTGLPCAANYKTIDSASYTLALSPGSAPHGTWSSLRTYRIRVTSEQLLAAVAALNAVRSGLGLSTLSTNVTAYRLQEAAVVLEPSWASGQSVNAGASVSNFTVRRYVGSAGPSSLNFTWSPVATVASTLAAAKAVCRAQDKWVPSAAAFNADKALATAASTNIKNLFGVPGQLHWLDSSTCAPTSGGSCDFYMPAANSVGSYPNNSEGFGNSGSGAYVICIDTPPPAAPGGLNKTWIPTATVMNTLAGANSLCSVYGASTVPTTDGFNQDKQLASVSGTSIKNLFGIPSQLQWLGPICPATAGTPCSFYQPAMNSIGVYNNNASGIGNGGSGAFVTCVQ